MQSYKVETEEKKMFRRNCVHLRRTNEVFTSNQPARGLPLDNYSPASTASSPDHASQAHHPGIDNLPLRTSLPSNPASTPVWLNCNTQEAVSLLPGNNLVRTCFGREIKRPKHLQDYVQIRTNGP